MAKVEIIYHEDGVIELLNNKAITGLMLELGHQVESIAAATATDAEKGPSGQITDYASSGFSTFLDRAGTKRPRVVIQSNAPEKTAIAIHFHTQKSWGIVHLRKALYSITKRGS